MENTDLSIAPYQATRAIVQSDRGNYLVQCGNNHIELKRGTDFENPVQKTGKNAGKKAFDKPILQKAGAEKIAFGFGLCQRYFIESKIEDAKNDTKFFMYVVRCDLVKFVPGYGEMVISNSYGSANTAEGRNGFKSAADSANSALKMAQKRALVGAAIAISGISDMFTQDIDNDSFMENSKAILEESGDAPITSRQIQRIYAIAANAGLNTEQAKQKIKAMGYISTKDIKQKDYDKVCKAMEGV